MLATMSNQIDTLDPQTLAEQEQKDRLEQEVTVSHSKLKLTVPLDLCSTFECDRTHARELADVTLTPPLALGTTYHY